MGSLHHIPFYPIFISHLTADPAFVVHLLEHMCGSVTQKMKAHSNTDMSCSLPLLLHMSIGTLFHWTYTKGIILRLCLKQDYMGNDCCLCCRKVRASFHCSSLHQHCSLCRGLCISLHWKIKCFKVVLSTKKKVHYLCNFAYDHRSGKYPPRSWYNVKFTGAWTFHDVLRVRKKNGPSLHFFIWPVL